MAQLAARGSHNPKVVGSKPTGGITYCSCAQLAALRSYEPMAQGSSPCRSIFSRSDSTQSGWLAEWSKALVLGTSLFGGVGSNPTPVTFASRRAPEVQSHGGLAQSVECVVRNDEAPGSKPGFSTFAGRGAGASCDVPLQSRKSYVVLL